MSGLSLQDKAQEQELITALKSRYPDFPTTNQEVAYALAKILGIKRRYVYKADAYMIWLMVGVVNYRNLDKVERKRLRGEINKFRQYNTQGVRADFIFTLNRKIARSHWTTSSLSISYPELPAYWTYSDDELKNSLEACKSYDEFIDKLSIFKLLGAYIGADILARKLKDNFFIKQLKVVVRNRKIQIAFATATYLTTDQASNRCKALREENSYRQEKWS